MSKAAPLAAAAIAGALFAPSAFVSSNPAGHVALNAKTQQMGAAAASSSPDAMSSSFSTMTATAATSAVLLAGSAASMLSSRRAAASSSARVVSLNAFEGELGVQAPLGFWDPLGISSDGDVGSFKRRRSVEIKHGRVCMLATMGYITPEITGKFPGYLSPGNGLKFADVPNGLAALGKVPYEGWFQILFYAGFVEFKGGLDKEWTEGTPGNVGWKPPLLAGRDPEARQKSLAAEIANGRLAMVAIIGMFFQDGLTGSAWGDWANYTDSPLRAFENEIGVQPPVGFWDPLGLAADGNADTFKRRRSSEIKHGRICMLATMGYITPTIAGKFPGFLSKDIAFADVPHGLKAIGTVPIQGWVQILAYCFYCEYAAGYGEDAKAGSDRRPGDMGWTPPLVAGGFIAKSPEKTREKLSVELANGRLAMMAIMGMFFQDGLTGEPWGDWALYTASPLR